MQKPKIPRNEKDRQAALDSYKIIDSLPEQSFDDLTLIASQICDTPIALISLIDNDRQWFKSKFGLEANETHRDISFCGHAINEPHQIFEVKNAKSDNRFSDNPLVTGDPNIGFYAGVPLMDSKELPLGTLCVIDHKPRELTEHQKKALEALAREVMNKIALRKTNLSLRSEMEISKEQLWESKSKYFRLYNQAPDMMVSVDAKTKKVIECNETLYKRLGYDQDEVLGKEIFELYHSDCVESVAEAFKEFVSKGRVHNKRLILKTKEGAKINVALKVTAVKDECGNILHSNSIWRDIDNLIEVEEELKMLNKNLELEVQRRNQELHFQKERLELALNGTRDGILDWVDVNKNEHWWSPRFYEMLGYNEGDIEPSIDVFLNELLHPKDLPHTQNEIQHCLEGGKPFDVEFRLKTKEYGYKWYKGRGDSIKGQNNLPTRMTGSVSDIHHQKNLEIELVETQKFLKKITDIAPSIIYVFNQQTLSNEYANRELGTVLGFSTDEIQELGADLMPTLCHPDDLNQVFAHFQAVAELNDNEVASIEYRMKHKNGEYRWLLSEDTVFERDNEGKIVKQLGVATDITKLKEAQEKLEKQASTLKTQNEDLRQFAYVATHDLKNPIMTVEGLLGFIKSQLPDPSEEINESFEFMEEELKNFNSTLKGLNDAIKIKESDIEKTGTYFNEVLQQLLPSYQKQINDLKGDLKINLVEGVQVKGSKVHIQSILQNLVSNAIKYRSLDKPPIISVTSKIEDNALNVTIQDNGLGIDLNKQKDKIFKMFNRFHTHSEGSGMGLYLVKQMVEKLGGSIKIESEVNSGTTFHVRFTLYQ